MSNEIVFAGFDQEKQKQYEEESQKLWGDTARRSIQLWNSYSEQKKKEIMREGSGIYADITAHMDLEPESPEIQAILKRWHQHLRNFYEPTPQVLRGLGEMYNDHPDFNATFTTIHCDLPAFLKKAIAVYVDNLETEWLMHKV